MTSSVAERSVHIGQVVGSIPTSSTVRAVRCPSDRSLVRSQARPPFLMYTDFAG